ncbi:hypothetical protein V7x_43030 [Crateriforma conspicua]|uniref:Uncharacterized protein n=1 Tax=Crateriforma conspicua TaxID=2527996 RepID=A0A5C6FPJ7_9PLAN|nr:hypothetical protein [Crateriforma conspicua]TWU62568.1 hypothetical protein V7x_43030 [Crateriforma conspicua]
MDPQTTWNSLLDAWLYRHWLDVSELAESLLGWLSKKGFPPNTMGTQQLGPERNRAVAIAACQYAAAQANAVLSSPNQIPAEVPFTLTCATCNNEGPDTYAEAIDEGWTCIVYYPAGQSENFLGECPVCRERDGEA